MFLCKQYTVSQCSACRWRPCKGQRDIAATCIYKYIHVHVYVCVEGAGIGNVEIVIVDAHGHKDACKPKISKSSETTFYVEYLAKETGRYSVHIYFAGKEIPYSPFTVNIGARMYCIFIFYLVSISYMCRDCLVLYLVSHDKVRFC